MKLTSFFRGTLLLVCLTACAGLVPVPTETPTPEPSQTPTATIVWFPPTSTPPPLPVQVFVPTAEPPPGMGDLLFTDAFDQPDLWLTSVASYASATVTRNSLVLSVNGHGPLSIVSLRSEPMVGDFYSEASAYVSLCSAKDEYGVVFRAVSSGDYYRFAINCNGQVRLERGRSGSISALTTWMPSGDASFGAPAEARIGVWAVGSEMRFFLNGHYQFTFRDPILHAGTLGFFAYASGSAPVTVSFSDLSAYSVFYVSPTPSATPTRTPKP